MKHSTYKAKAIDTGQEDNIIRDGVLTTKQAYDMFLKAGINAKQWLEKTYKNNNIREPDNEAKETIEQVVRYKDDDLDYRDDLNIVNQNLEYASIKREELLKQRAQIEKQLSELNNKQNNTTEPKTE